MAAKDEFAEGIREVRILLDTSKLTVSGEREDQASGRANAAQRASVVLLVAHFESFLKSIALEFVDHLAGGVVEARLIPASLRDLHTMSVVQNIQKAKSLDERKAHFRKLERVSVLWKDGAKPPAGTLNAELLSRQVTSAKADKIDDLFKLMGNAQNVCDGDIDVDIPNSGLKTLNIRYGLRDAIGCRDAVAHGDSERKPTYEDVERYIALLGALANRLDRKAANLKVDDSQSVK